MAAFATLLLSSTSALATPAQTWTGSQSSDWFQGGNWTQGTAPSTTDTATINVSNPAVLSGQAVTMDTLLMGTTATSPELTISDGGTLTTGGLDAVGSATGSFASVTITGSNSRWTNSSLIVGSEGEGAISITEGGALEGSFIHLGRLAGGSGSITVDGATSSLTASGSLNVGYTDEGELMLTNGGQASAASLQVGMSTGARGRVSVESGSDLTVSSGTLYIGNQTGTTGEMAVTGSGSTLTNSGQTYLGLSGNGSLTMSDQATASLGSLVMAQNTDSTGTLRVEGGSVMTVTGQLVAAQGQDSTANITVSGTGSRVVAQDGLQMGFGTNSSSTITIENGGTLETVGNGLYVDGGNVISVTGQGSGLLVGTEHSGVPTAWNDADGWLSISHATVTVSDGAHVETDGLHVQGGATGAAVMTLSGSDTTMNAGMVIYIGGNGSAPTGAGSLTIEDGAQASAARIFLGIAATDSGRLLLTGAGSTLMAVPDGQSAPGNFGVGFYGSGVAVIQNGARLSVANALRIADMAGSTGTLVIGAEEGQAAADVGTVETGAGIVFGAGTGELVFNHTSSNYVFDSDITGNGTIKAVAGTTNLTGDSSGFTGAINVTGGVLNVAGAIGAISTVESGARLTGAGTVGGVVALSGSTVAPGNSPGTLTVTGNYNQAAGATYAAEIVPGGSISDLIDISGTATLASGAILDVSVYGTGNYILGTRYTVLSATGGLTGTYTVTGSTDLSTFYGLDAAYDSNNVYLDVVQTRAFAEAALTRNQLATANALQTLAAASNLRSIVGSSATDDIARSAFDQVSGEIHASAKTALLDDSRFVRDATARQVRSSIGTEGPGVWMQGYGTWGSFDGDGNAAGLDRNAGGLFVGADGEIADALRLGIVAGYGHSSLSADGGRGFMSIDSYSLGVYGGGQWDSVTASFGLTQTWHQLSSSRQVDLSGLNNALSSDYDARSTQVYGDVGYRIEMGSASIEPFAGLAYVNLHTDSFTETGGETALSGSGDTTDATFTTLGLRSNGSFDLQGTTIRANGMIGWRHALDDTRPTTTNSLAGSSAFTVSGVPLARDVAVIEAGVAAQIAPTASLGLTYTGQFGSGVSDHGIKANLNVRF
ncbi:autotransporter domain-containing protein [Rhizobium sp. CSW-27]|uniref:autotransporter domain-containing protein n=1 Tax=Rhizobium sp. CSW-27 TaxID=2839985 RepID=UPI001C00D33A|nr:autotransporter domain-containing protein [Rhizobium sp. CSW-27]MBT9369735.1 autotransporter domain-containing protein [Rhizobium sp. CSW-27]